MKRLGGWWRLWVVASILMAVISVLTATSVRDKDVDLDRALARSGQTRPAGCVPGTVSLQESDAYEGIGVPVDGPWNDYKVPPPPPGFILDKNDPNFKLVASCTSFSRVFEYLTTAALMSLILMTISLVSRWIYRGFKAT